VCDKRSPLQQVVTNVLHNPYTLVIDVDNTIIDVDDTKNYRVACR